MTITKEEFLTKIRELITIGHNKPSIQIEAEPTTLDEDIINTSCWCQANAFMSSASTKDMASMFREGIAPIDTVDKAMAFWDNAYELYLDSEEDPAVLDNAYDQVKEYWYLP